MLVEAVRGAGELAKCLRFLQEMLAVELTICYVSTQLSSNETQLLVVHVASITPITLFPLGSARLWATGAELCGLDPLRHQSK